MLTDQPGKDSWPITGATFILMHPLSAGKAGERRRRALKFFDWALRPAATRALTIWNAVLPASVKDWSASGPTS